MSGGFNFDCSESRKKFVQEINGVSVIEDAAEYLFTGSDFKKFRRIKLHSKYVI